MDKPNDSFNEEHPGLCVMACAYSSDRYHHYAPGSDTELLFHRSVPAFCCILDENGEVMDFLRMAHILTHRNSRNDYDRVKKVRRNGYSAATRSPLLCRRKR